MNTRHISISLLIFALSGCASDLERIPQERLEANIEYLDGKFKVCRENCPVPTPKEIDDTVPMEVLVSEMFKKYKPVDQPSPAAEQEAQKQVHKDEGPIQTIQQYEIHFDFGMSRPNAEGEIELLRFEENVRGQRNLKIELIGRTDDIGTSKFNRQLARKRALNIASWIKARGIKARIELSTKAKCCRAAPYDKDDQTFKEMRRVTIITRQTGEVQMDK